MYFGGIGMESNRSLSFASYNCACVIKTLPNMENASAIVPAMAKYSHVSPISHNGTSSANTTNNFHAHHKEQHQKNQPSAGGLFAVAFFHARRKLLPLQLPEGS